MSRTAHYPPSPHNTSYHTSYHILHTTQVVQHCTMYITGYRSHTTQDALHTIYHTIRTWHHSLHPVGRTVITGYLTLETTPSLPHITYTCPAPHDTPQPAYHLFRIIHHTSYIEQYSPHTKHRTRHITKRLESKVSPCNRKWVIDT